MAYDLVLRKSVNRNWSRRTEVVSGMGEWDEIGIVSSSVARAAADQVRVNLDALNIEITAWYQTVAPQRKVEHGNFVNAWIKFRDNVYKMVDDSKRLFNPELASSIVERMNKTQQDIRNWRAAWERLSQQKSVTVETQLPTAPSAKGSSMWPYIAVGLGSVALVGGVLVYFMAPKVVAGASSGMVAGGLGKMLGGAKG